MAARRNDPDLPRQVLRLYDAGIGCKRGAALLGICHTTFNWYVRHRATFPAPGEPYAVDALGERVSQPPGRV